MSHKQAKKARRLQEIAAVERAKEIYSATIWQDYIDEVDAYINLRLDIPRSETPSW